MKHEFPDAMRTSDGMAGRLRRGKAGQRLEYRGPVPRLALKRSPELLLQSVDFRSHSLHPPFYRPNDRAFARFREYAHKVQPGQATAGGPIEGKASQDGPDPILSGSSTLTSTLLEHGLADEVLLVVYPVLLGTGKRFFAEGTPPRSFELVSTKAMPSGIILSAYKVAGPLKTG